MFFAKAIQHVLRVPVRSGAIWASEDEAGRRLLATFQEGLKEHGVAEDVPLAGKPLCDFRHAEVAAAAQAASLADGGAFLRDALGDENWCLLDEMGVPRPEGGLMAAFVAGLGRWFAGPTNPEDPPQDAPQFWR